MRRLAADHAAERDVAVEVRHAVGESRWPTGSRARRGPRRSPTSAPAFSSTAARARDEVVGDVAVVGRHDDQRLHRVARRTGSGRMWCGLLSGHVSVQRDGARADDGEAVAVEPHDLRHGRVGEEDRARRSRARRGSARRARTGAASGARPRRRSRASSSCRAAARRRRGPSAAMISIARPNSVVRPRPPRPATSRSGSIACIRTSTGASPPMSPLISAMCSAPCGLVGVDPHRPVAAEGGGDGLLLPHAHEVVVPAAVGDQVRDRPDLQPVLLGEGRRGRAAAPSSRPRS